MLKLASNLDSFSYSYHGGNNNINNSYHQHTSSCQVPKFNNTGYNVQPPTPATPTLSKEERRQLFEKQMKEKEEAEAAAAAASESNPAQQTLPDSSATSTTSEENTGRQANMQWHFDMASYQWLLVPSVPSRPARAVATPTESASTPSANPEQPNLPVSSSSKTEEESLEAKIKKYLGNNSLSPTSSKIFGQSMSPTSSHLLQAKSVRSPTLNPELKNKLSVSAEVVKSEDKALLAIEQKLPTGWKCKRNDKGLIYYYNLRTKVSQWECPVAKPASEGAAGNSEGVPSTSSSNSEEVFKSVKDLFREKLSKVVVNILKPYLNEKVKFGHIKNNEDFKHLARKFTHTILEKEISRVARLEALEVDARIKAKSHEYISTYMSKFRTSAGYCRRLDV